MTGEDSVVALDTFAFDLLFPKVSLVGLLLLDGGVEL